ncbi:MAG: polymerase ECF-type sigma factor [Eubacterium sp.]|nr:polymerase ECF-type sigma factor [Eubacterium sp.]
MKSKAAAEDVTQEAFIQVFRKYHMYDHNRSIEPWIYKITINTARNIHRRQKWLSFFGDSPEQESKEFIEAEFFRAQEKKELWQEINKLSHKSREVIVLHFYIGLKLNEIAGILNIPLGTCKSRLNTALTALRKRYADSSQIDIIQGGELNGSI